MVIPEIKSILSLDVERPALPPDPDNCHVQLDVGIGPKDAEAAELFSLSVVTPKYLAHSSLPSWGRGMLIVTEFSWSAVDRMLERLIDRASKESWNEVANELSKTLHWEYENYRRSEV